MNFAPRLSIVFDNDPGESGLTSLWGFSALIETGEKTILFDTGSNGRVLLKNLTALGLAVEEVDLVFLSHPHWDHIGGLDSVLEANREVSVVLHEGFPAHLVRDLRRLCREVVVVGTEPLELAPGLHSTGQLEGPPPEHGLVLKLGPDTVVLCGCAHPGVERMVARGVAVLGRPVLWAIGGFHLAHADDNEVAECVRRLLQLGVTDIVPTHCTGEAAKAAFARAYGVRCRAGGAGRVIEFRGTPDLT